jgi:cytochrome c553
MRTKPGYRLGRSAVVIVLMALGACSTEAPSTNPGRSGPELAGRCPEPRSTPGAPARYAMMPNPLPKTAENLERGRLLFERDAKPMPCADCHGVNGDGKGPRGRDLIPPPRNFTCADTMRTLTDGQMYWVIENGSGEFHEPPTQGAQQIERPARGTPFATAMRGHREYLSETQIWELILYIRSLARPG